MDKMTVSECLKEWLSDYTELEFGEALTDYMEAPKGEQTNPKKTVIPYNNGSSQCTEYYRYLAQLSTKTPEQNVNHQRILSDLEEWVEEKNAQENYPELSQAGNLTCTEVKVVNSGTITSQEDNSTNYKITITITYLKER